MQARIDGLIRKEHLVETFAVVMLLLVAYLLLAIYLGILTTVRRLREVSELHGQRLGGPGRQPGDQG